jgi:transposase InsO family protein
MRMHGIDGLRNGKVQRTTLPGLSPVAALDLVRRNFTALRPDAVWLSDFTYIRTWKSWSYLAVVLDVHTRRIVGLQVASHRRQSLVTALDNAMAESIMSTLKREVTKRYLWRTRLDLDLELALVAYISWHNARRGHRSLKVVEEGRIRRLAPL